MLASPCSVFTALHEGPGQLRVNTATLPAVLGRVHLRSERCFFLCNRPALLTSQAPRGAKPLKVKLLPHELCTKKEAAN